MHNHGADLVLDFNSDDLESKIELIIQELRHILKDSLVEGGKDMVRFCIDNKN